MSIKTKVIGITGIFAVLCFTSCEIGLGKQVDVDPPKIQMESPTENARTREIVTFNGTWTDDMEIKEVIVELKETNQKQDSLQKSYNLTAKTQNNGGKKTEGSWECVLNSKNEEIPDGTYTVTAKAIDTYGHTNEVSTLITIDNTPPLIVLESPSTKDISNPMTYGKTFSVIGRGADEQNGGTIDSVDAVIYDENSVEIARKTFTGISTSIDFSIADWNEEGDNFYKKIYGTDENAGTKNYYLELIAYDDARQVPPKEGDRGNSTNILYLSNDLSVIDGYKPNIAYQIKNGSLSRSATTDTESYKNLEDALNKKENQITRLSFSLNPVNNPYFEVQGYEALGKEPNLENETYGFMNKNKLTVNIYVGRDKKQIKPETISVWLEPCDLSGKIIPNSTKIVLLEKGAINSSGVKTEKAIYTEDFKTSATSCTWISNSLDSQSVKNLEIGKYYRICVDAEDYGNVKIRNQNDYGIKFTTVNSAPIIVITEPQGGTKNIAMSAAYDVKGTVKTSSKISKISFYKNEYKENAPNENLIAEIAVNPNEQITESEISSITNKIVKNSDKSNSSQAYYNFAYTVEENKITDSSYTLFAVAFDDTKQSTQKEIYIENDKTLPKFDEPTITPVVSDETDGIDYVNGTVTISQLISDDKKVKESWWSDAETMPNKNGTDGWNKGNVQGSSATNLKFMVDTTDFNDNEDKKIWLKAEDSSGNIETSEITLHIKQKTDAPVVKLSNTECAAEEIQYNKSWSETDYITAKQHKERTVFGTTNNSTILGSISDDDGIGEVKVYYQSIKLNDSNVVEVGEKQDISLTNEPGGKTTYSLNAKMPSEQGTYLITIEVTDSKNETKYDSKTVGPFLVAVDDGAPKLKIETQSDNFQKNKFTVKGTVDDKNAVLYRCEKKDDETGTQITVNPDGTWEDTVTVTGSEANDFTVYYKAKDDYDQTAVEEFKYKYDPEPPTFEITKVQGDDWGKFNKDELYGTTDKTTYFMIGGTVSDIKKGEKGASGFKNSNFYYYFGQTEPAKENNIYKLDDENWKTCKIESANADGTEGKFTASINFYELGAKDGEQYNIYFAVKDDAGNVSVINEAFNLSVTIDSTSPNITAAKLGEISAAPKLILNVTEEVALDIESLKVLNNGAEFAKENYKVEKTEQPEASGNYTITVTINEGKVPVGENKFTFSIKDKAKNESKSENPISIINKAPVIGERETGIPNEAYKVEKEGIQYSYINNKIEATATVTCEGSGNKLKSVEWKDSETDFFEKAGVCTPGADGKITVTMPKNIDDYENKYITRTVTATNIYGESNKWTYYFILDKTAPVLKTESSGDVTSIGGTNVNDLGTIWFNKDTLELKGVYEEKGSGVKQIEYKLSIGNGESQTGTVYTSGNNNGKENFASIISGFAESTAQNTITLTVTDNAKNTSSSSPYYVNIDKTPPTLKENVAPAAAAENSETSTIWYRFTGESKWNKYDNSILTNNAKNIELTGYFEDKSEFGDNYRQSGVREITVNVNNKVAIAKVYKKTDGTENWSVPQDGTGFEVSEDNSKGYWFATIPVDYLEREGTYSAKVTITDNANNSNSTPLSFLVDKKSPTVTVEMPSAKSTLNGKNTFSGKVNDNNDVKSIALYYFIGDDFSTPKTFTDFGLLQNCKKDTASNDNLSEITSWKFTDINVNELLSSGEESGKMWLLPVAYDKAGNCNINNINTEKITSQKCTEITIDLNSDRPTVKFNNLSKSGDDAYLNAGTLNISLEDDDGIAEVKYYFGDEKPDSWENVKTATLNSGSVSIDLGDDGKKTLWFKITDTEDGTFETANSSDFKQPYVKFGSAQKIDNNAAIIFTKDTTSPELSELKFCFGTDKNSLSEPQDFASEDAAVKVAVVVGGTERKYVVFKATAVDNGSGIKAVTLNVSGKKSYDLTQSKENVYQTAAIDVSTWSEGSHTLTFTATDNAGLSVTETKQITVDNNGPEINIITPEQNDTQTGIVTFSGTANDSYSSVNDIRYLVLNNEYYSDDGKLISEIGAKVKEAILKDDYSCSNTGTKNTWKFKLDGVPDGENKSNALLPANDEQLEKYSKVPHTDSDIYTMTVYLYAKDSLGNESLKSHEFNYNPFGDRPTAEITFPKGTETEQANVNGSIRITGSATDNVSVSKVYVQIDVNNDGSFNDADKNLLAAMKDAGKGIYTIITDTDLDQNADTSALKGETFWGIAANGTSSWNLTINQYGEMLSEYNKIFGENSKYGIKIRAVAVDNNKKFGNWSVVQHVVIDNNIPSIGKRRNLLEYKAGSDNDYAVRPYTPDMYSKGKTELELSVEDVNGIKQVMYYIADTEEGLSSSATGNKVDLDKAEKLPEDGTKGYIVKIPLTEGSSESGTKYVKVVATKNSDSETTAYEKFSINFDNSAPEIADITLNGVAYEHSDKKIVNSNGTYFTLGGSVQDEGGSGFDKVLFYYYREKSDGENKRIYDPMIDSTNKDAERIKLSDLQSRPLDGQTLYGTEQSINITVDSSGEKSFTIKENSHIRAGGVVEIAGTWFTIEKIEGTKVTLKSNPPVTGETTAFFAYAQVIDNTGSEKNNENGDITGDDGDGMAESIIKSLNTWSYDATFRSNYIPDGPGKLFVFAFDKAGNVSAQSFEASVQNNAPRLTRVMLATDLNGDGRYQYYSETETGPVNDMSDNATPNGTEFGEFAFYSTLNNKGEASNVAAVTLPNGRDPFIVKNNLLAVPEFVGGNGKLSYTYKIVDSLTDATVTVITDSEETNKFATDIEIESTGTNPFENSKTVLKDSQGNEITVQSKMFELDNIVLENHESWVGNTKNTKYLAATFWDSAEETTPGKDSCYALLKMPLIINVNDDVLPTADIIPFYWNSKEDSSFVYDDDGNPLGHIDIPKDGGTPGVSGVVYVEGTAYDDTRLSEILIKKPGENDAFEKMASFADGKWTYTNDDFKVLEDLGITQKGHTVKWRLKIDMSGYGIATGRTIKVQAKDAATKANVSADNESQTTKSAPTPTYIMNFVPYIKSIYATNIGSANRSRLGKFPVRAGEEMTIEGMNFVKDASYTVNFYKTVDGKPASTPTESLTRSITTAGQITVNAPQYSRWVEVVVNDVPTQNNTNTNDGCNIEAGYVAKDKDTDNDLGKAKANKAGTNFWTDDRYVSVWNVGTTLPGSINPHSGVMKKVRAEDTINNNGNIAIKGEDTNIAVKEMTDKCITFISSDDMRVYLYNNNEKNKTLGSNDTSTFTSPVDAVDMVVLGGLPYYVLQTNYVGNSNAESWGPGLILSRQGFKYNKDTYETTNTLNESQYQWIIEKQGSTKSATTRDSSTGYDSILYQFKNPRIAGWHTDNPGDDATLYSNSGGNYYRSKLDYVYVSYYDSYAKCLKFAAFRSGWDVYNNTITGTATGVWGGGNSGDNELVAEVRSADGNMKSGATVVAGYDTTENNPTSFEEKAGEWSDIVVDATSGSPIPVIVYYNETKKCLEVARGNSKFPKSSNYNKTDIKEDEKHSGADAWYKSEIRLDNLKADFGRYVSCAIDAAGNLHVAAQNATNASLYYLYLKKNGTSYTKEKEVLLDSASGSGVWTDIELKNPNGKTLAEMLPTVSYMNSSYVGTTEGIKVAYISSGTENNIEFDVMTDPAIWSAGNQRTSVMAHVKEVKDGEKYAPVAVGFNSDMFAVDFLRGEE